jgi:hypothetical protein
VLAPSLSRGPLLCPILTPPGIPISRNSPGPPPGVRGGAIGREGGQPLQRLPPPAAGDPRGAPAEGTHDLVRAACVGAGIRTPIPESHQPQHALGGCSSEPQRGFTLALLLWFQRAFGGAGHVRPVVHPRTRHDDASRARTPLCPRPGHMPQRE